MSGDTREGIDSSDLPADPTLVRRFLVGAVVVMLGLSVVFAAWETVLPHLVDGWLQILGITIAAVGVLLCSWSLGARPIGVLAGAATPGAFLWCITNVAEGYLLDSQQPLETVTAGLQVFGFMWAIVGAPLFLYYYWVSRRAAAQAIVTGKQQPSVLAPMSLYQKLMIIATFFTGFATLAAVLLTNWLK